MGYRGPKFTWCNGRGDGEEISERLDRFLGNHQLNLLFPQVVVTHGIAASSDHLPIWLDTEGQDVLVRRKILFRFEAMWVGNEMCTQIIKEVWDRRGDGDSMLDVMGLIKGCSENLFRWNKSSFGHVRQQLNGARERLEQLHQTAASQPGNVRLKAARDEVQIWLERKRLCGDRDPRCTGLRRLIRILDFFRTLFTASEQRRHLNILENIQQKVNDEMNRDLTKIYTADEVNEALKQMHPTKAHGPDGMSPIFYQKYWHVMGNLVTSTVLRSLNSGVLPTDLNHTLISLIPKKKCCEMVADFRPISLYNVIYKLVSKTQGAFVPGRLITDNVLVAYELVNYLRNKRKGKTGYMSLKLDMSKAYDRVERDFLEVIMLKLGFARSFVKLIMQCISTVSFSVLVNGLQIGPIFPSRGIRQGDPLSPYLFLLCTKGLTSLLKTAARNNTVRGLRVCGGAPEINHLLFADDSIIFCKADVSTTRNIQSIFDKYESASGQKINRQKTAMVFSRNVRKDKQGLLLRLRVGSGINYKVGKNNCCLRGEERIFKARYFPQGDSFASKLGPNPSYTWKGIWEAKKWLVQGCRWRVGSGENIHIWKDAWIPGHKPLVDELILREGIDMDETVDIPLDPETKGWRMDHIRALFNPIVVADILKIRLSSNQYEDKWIWTEEKNGVFSVKSAYRLIQDLRSSSEGESLDATDQRKLWKMQVPKRIQIFAWRACKDILPTLHNLKKKKVDVEDRCCFYKEAPEDVHHALVYCPSFKGLWQNYVPVMQQLPLDLDFLAVIILDRGTKRNKMQMEQLLLQPEQVINHSLSMHKTFTDLRVSTTQNANRACRWNPPPRDFQKLIVDGAVFLYVRKVGVGVVLRDDKGKLVMPASKIENEVENPSTIELVALLRGLQLIVHLGFSKLVVESDCMLLVQELNKEQDFLSADGNLIIEAKSLLKHFQEVEVQHVHRMGNEVAQSLARYTWNVDNISMWWEHVPTFIDHPLCIDQNNMF
ncbi:uncharacterized protein LOC121249435 [Juglans microcarpa x Juglans regia]|uniref:uncharacterized protein LOC121249435 n=1 Tax=Juglans microcarpa x Juglans regia TaxID=2249226 RepID=UPI001B7E94DD|nr:uncharacterized protein LOC121249435 [Juglans microcarpa x Juglans regia]